MRLIWPTVRIAVSVATLTYLLNRYDAWDSLSTAWRLSAGVVLIGVVLLGIQVIVAAIRWNVVLRKLQIFPPLVTVLRVSYIAAFLNTFLPAGIAGDVARVWLTRDFHTQLAAAVASVLIDRIGAILTLSLLGLAVEPFVWAQLSSADRRIAFAIPVLATVAMLGTAAVALSDRLIPRSVLQSLVFGRFVSRLDRLAAELRGVLCHSRTLIGVFVLGVAGHLTICAAVYVLSLGLGIDVTLTQCLAIVPLVLLFGAMPISIGGWGTRELAMVYLFGLFGVGGTEALALSIELGVCSVIASLPGAAFMMYGRRSQKDESQVRPQRG